MAPVLRSSRRTRAHKNCLGKSGGKICTLKKPVSPIFPKSSICVRRQDMEASSKRMMEMQERSIFRYHALVAEKRNDMLRALGIDPEKPWTVEQVLSRLERENTKR